MCVCWPEGVCDLLRANKRNKRNKQIIVRERPRHYYHFLTTVCAVLGGVFTCAGILDAILYNGE